MLTLLSSSGLNLIKWPLSGYLLTAEPYSDYYVTHKKICPKKQNVFCLLTFPHSIVISSV